MSSRSIDFGFPFPRRAAAIVVSGVLTVFSFVFMVLCFSQLGAWPPLMSGAQAAFAVASILQVLLVALGSTIIFASWKENSRVIRFTAYATVAHLALNVTVLALLLVAAASTMPCPPERRLRCPKLVTALPTWIGLSAVILVIQPCLSLIVFSYSFHLQDRSRRPNIPEVSSRSLSVSISHKPEYKRLSSGSETWPNVELGAVESAVDTKMPESAAGYGGGMRTYMEAERNEKERLRREMEMENEENNVASFPIPSTSETGILTPLGLQWRDGDLPPYAS